MVSAVVAFERGDREQGQADVESIIGALDRAVRDGLLLDIALLVEVAPWAAELARDHRATLQAPAALLGSRFEVARRIASNEVGAIGRLYQLMNAPASVRGLATSIERHGQEQVRSANDVDDIESIWRDHLGPRSYHLSVTVELLLLTGAILDSPA